MTRKIAIIGVGVAMCAVTVGIAPPTTKVQNVTDSVAGVSITDPYRWLEDQNSPETRAWIDQQAKYTGGMLAKAAGRDRIRETLRMLLKVEVVSPPTARGGRYFFMKRLADQEQAVLYVRKGLNGSDEVLVDPNPLSKDHTTSVVMMGISRDGTLLAYGLRQGGEDETTMSLMDVSTGKELPDRFPRARYFSVAIEPNRQGFYYALFKPEGARIFHHKMGSGPSSDEEIFGQGHDASQIIGCGLSDDGRYLMLTVSYGSAGTKTEVFLQDLTAKTPIRPIVEGIEAKFSPDFAGDRLYLMTNWKAPNGRVLLVDPKDPAKEHWKEVIPERKSVLDGFTPVGGKLVTNWLENVTTKIEILDGDGKPLRSIPLPGLGVGIGPFGRWDSDEAFYVFSSFARPTTIYRYDIANGTQEVWYQRKSPLDPASVEVKQVWYESKDKTRVPMFLAYKKGLKLDGSNPALLTGYGGFNASVLPSYSPLASAWMSMGGVFAQANLRGGGEFGETWHKAGMFEKKQNVFDDFVAAAEYLVAKGYTRTTKLAIEGGSNGGLLVGAAMTQRPDLFQAVICGAPLLDMIRYQKFKVARFWVSEYGSSDDPKQFAYIYKYSPYQHVERGVKYPAVMFVTGDADTRVDPLHARKMAALMQASTSSDRPILLRYDTKAGHSGGLPVDRQIDTLTDELSFLAWQLGMQ